MDPTTLVLSIVSACHTVVIEEGPLLTSLFLAGLVGSGAHCIAMCGPFVMAQTTARLASTSVSQMSELTRLRGALLVPYHLGRLTTYVGLGALAGGILGGISQVPGFRYIAALLLLFAALFFLAYAFSALKRFLPFSGPSADSPIGQLVNRIAKPLLENPTGFRGYGLGLALGFLPCGLLYGALAAAATAGGALAGAIAMGGFALGTIPALIAMGLAGHVMGNKWRDLTAKLGAALMVANACALTYFALDLAL